MAADELIHVTRWHNGDRVCCLFSDCEMARRCDGTQNRMDEAGIDACLFTAYHNICYFLGFLYYKFRRHYSAVLTRDGVTTVSAAIDGGQP